MREQGVVMWFGDDYGFIRTEYGDTAFVHWSQVVGAREYLTLYEDERVEFTPVDEPRGLAAHSVTVIESPQDSACSRTGQAYPARNRYRDPDIKHY